MSRAVRFDSYGGIERLYVTDVVVAPPGPGEVVVDVRAAGINPGEAGIREGDFADVWPATFPSGQGSDLAGVVSAVGGAVTTVAVGEEVLGWTDERASHAEQVVVPAGQVVLKPPALPWEVAGSLFVAGTTAWAALRAVGCGAGDVVAVSGAAGGVGSLVVQLARLRGIQVIGIASQANHEWLASFGVTPVAYGPGLVERLRAAAPQGIDAFVDTFGTGYVRVALELGIPVDRIDTIRDFTAAQELGVKADGNAEGADPAVLAELAGLAAAGSLQVPIAATYPLDDVRLAFGHLERRHTRGKIVLIP